MKKKKKNGHRHYIAGRHGDEDAATLAARLAPPEEKRQEAAAAAASAQAGAKNNGGTLVVNTGALKLPEGFVRGDEPRRLFGLEPVVIVIVALALVFIAFIAWRITKMPVAADDPPPHTIEQGGASPAPGR